MVAGRISDDYRYSYHVVFERVIRKKRHNKKGEYIGLEKHTVSTVINSSFPLSLGDIRAFVEKANSKAVAVEILSVDEVGR